MFCTCRVKPYYNGYIYSTVELHNDKADVRNLMNWQLAFVVHCSWLRSKFLCPDRISWKISIPSWFCVTLRYTEDSLKSIFDVLQTSLECWKILQFLPNTLPLTGGS